MHYNGPAVAGVSVTRRSQPATYHGSLAEIESRWQDGYGMCFCNQGTKFSEYWRVRDTILLIGRSLVPYCDFVKSSCALASVPGVLNSVKAGANCKNHDKLITATVRVSG
jgi:hypothetical protein